MPRAITLARSPEKHLDSVALDDAVVELRGFEPLTFSEVARRDASTYLGMSWPNSLDLKPATDRTFTGAPRFSRKFEIETELTVRDRRETCT
jgi:hypothetical protein